MPWRPPRFDCLRYLRQAAAAGAPEQDWLEAALGGTGTAALWTGARGLVAPAGYRHLPGVHRPDLVPGWPVRLRSSGGGVVPQGPGILNLSLAYDPGGPLAECAEPVYRHLCALLAQALAALGIASFASAVAGSFCDGRFNLACGDPDRPRKLAGTAQRWRSASGRQAVLAHAVLLLDTDPGEITAAVNALEVALGTGRHCCAEALSTVAAELGAAPALPDAGPAVAPAPPHAGLAQALAPRTAGLDAALAKALARALDCPLALHD